MKRVNVIFVFLLLVVSYKPVWSQSFEVPDYQFKTKEDYAKYEAQIIEAVNWLEATPSDKETAKRRNVNAFIVQWVSGSPSVSVEIYPYIMDFSKKNPEMLAAFMGGWTRWKLQNPKETDRFKFNLEGVKTVMKIYQLGGVKKDKAIEEMIKLNEKGKLEEWLKGKVNG